MEYDQTNNKIKRTLYTSEWFSLLSQFMLTDASIKSSSSCKAPDTKVHFLLHIVSLRLVPFTEVEKESSGSLGSPRKKGNYFPS